MNELRVVLTFITKSKTAQAQVKLPCTVIELETWTMFFRVFVVKDVVCSAFHRNGVTRWLRHGNAARNMGEIYKRRSALETLSKHESSHLPD